MARHPALRMGIVALCVAGSGCATTQTSRDVQPAGAASPEGSVAYRFLADPALPKPEIREDQEFMGPRPIDAPLPEYPDIALRETLPPTTVALRITVDTDGTVRDIIDSPLEEATAHRFSALFRDAAVRAVRTWEFNPAELRTLVPGADLDGDGRPDYRVIAEHATLRTYLDLRFTFSVVEGRGEVTFGTTD